MTGGIAAALVGTGILGWCGGTADLVSLPAVVAATATGCAFGILGSAGILPAALATSAVLALGGAAAGANQLGVLLAVLLGAPTRGGRVDASVNTAGACLRSRLLTSQQCCTKHTCLQNRYS